jgi:hypothetical protein
MDQQTFIIDCPFCKAKVAAIEKGSVSTTYIGDDGYPEGIKLVIGSCPGCRSLFVGKTEQVDFAGLNADRDRWSNVAVRIYPKPPKTFLSNRIPQSATESLSEADRSLQANANIAAVAMLGRALEAVCRDILDPKPSTHPTGTQTSQKKIMLGEGIRMLKDKEIIDGRLYDWSQQLREFNYYLTTGRRRPSILCLCYYRVCL